jgi:hypothetical protein
METLSVSVEQHRRSLEAHMRDIALIGRMGSGKDTVAARLCEAHGYTRLAFADAVREMALAIDPDIMIEHKDAWNDYPRRLSAIVTEMGWDQAKRSVPEVRRLLQNCGVTVRSYDPEFWINVLRTKWAAIDGPVVITDCRFANEYEWLRRNNVSPVRVTRRGTQQSDHVSETELDMVDTVYSLVNNSDIEGLNNAVDHLAKHL